MAAGLGHDLAAACCAVASALVLLVLHATGQMWFYFTMGIVSAVGVALLVYAVAPQLLPQSVPLRTSLPLAMLVKVEPGYTEQVNRAAELAGHPQEPRGSDP